MYDAAPFGYLTVDLDGTMLKLNLAGAAMLGGARDLLLGQRLSGLLDFHGARTLRAMLASRLGEHGESLELHTRHGDTRTLRACASPDPSGATFLVARMDASLDRWPIERYPTR